MERIAALAALKLSLYLRGKVDPALFQRYSHFISPDVTEEEVSSYPEEPEELLFGTPVLAQRYRKLYDLCAGDAIALSAIQLYLLAAMNPRTLSLLEEVCGNRHEEPTIEIAARITLRSEELLNHMPAIRRAYERVAWLLQAEPGDFLRASFRVDSRLCCWLAGDDQPDALLSGCEVFTPTAAPRPAYCRLSDEIAQAVAFAQQGFCWVHVRGDRTSGKRFFVQEVARQLGREVLFVPYRSISEKNRVLAAPWQKILRELLLTNRLLCLCDVAPHPAEAAGTTTVDSLVAQLPLLERDLLQLNQRLRQLQPDHKTQPEDATRREAEPGTGLEPATEAGRKAVQATGLKPATATEAVSPLFLTTEDSLRILPFVQCAVLPVAIRPCSILESATLWRTFAEERQCDPAGLPIDELAAKMTLTAGQIKRILQLLVQTQPDGPWDTHTISRLCYQVLDDGRYHNIRFVDTSYTWDSLRLKPTQKQTLLAICHQVRHQGLVLDTWGLRDKFPYGRCISALFSGPPGTGKTMAAQVLAHTLGLELYKIDLSQVVDKYIGETEKRLKQVFEQADKSNMILFFDEADAILGKRVEMKDAKDKYANTEVAYLLQCMEEYTGVVLMATNLINNIDSAFTRRFRYHIAFTLPDEDLRRSLWADVLPPTVPQEGIRLDYLARQFELPGSQIKNIALNACYKAAADGGVLRMPHIIEAIFLERKKEGKVMLASEFGEYGNLLYDWMET